MKFDALLWILNILQTIAGLPLLARAWKRSRRRRTDFASARFFGPKLASPPGTPRGVRLVLVGLGFAEARWADELGRRIQIARPDVEILWAISDRDAIMSANALPEGQKMVAPPFDYAPAVSFWLRRVRPDAMVFLEKFLYANFARLAHNRGVRVGAVAARLRDHRGGRYKLGTFFQSWLLSSFDFIGLRSQQEQEHLGSLGNLPNVRVTGSLKFWPQLPAIAAKQQQELQKWLFSSRNQPLLVAGSTQPGDEAWVLEAFASLREKYGARLLIAPRHVERAGEVEALCTARGWKVSRRSQKTKGDATGDATCDVLLLDTIGELTHAYGGGRAAFVGGTLTGTGHNVLEPIAHGIPVFFGPKRGTFAFEQEMCETAGAGFRVQTPEELERGFERAIFDEKWRAQVAQNARELNARGALAWDETVAAILEMLEKTS